ncbi:MAG TPA: ABC transporter permease subunit [candidate division Zixibacteria bacterium]|nr:ABC transporter permease subunit [candidate division Zixibacteria bacterium]
MTAIGQSAPSGVSFWSRIYGLGSVFAKTIRDSRRATLITAGLLALLIIGVSRAITAEFDTPQSRVELENLVNAVPPILQGMAGKVVNIDTLGGYLQYKYGIFFPLVVSLWSILALSGTLAGETQRGSLDFLAASGRSRRRIALEKLSGHVLVLGLACLVTFLSIAYAGSAFATLPGDEISVLSAFGYAAWLGLLALVAGGLAFALGPFVGRGAAAGIAGAVTFAGFILNGYQAPVPALAPFANLTWWGWTQDHVALAGQYDWAAVGVVAVVAVALLAVGIEAFARRDIGVTTALPWPSMPRWLLGLSGPIARAASMGLGAALAWGIGVGFFGLALGGSAQDFMEQLGESPEFRQLLATIFPGVDYASAGGFLQLLFVDFGVILAGLAAASLVSSWASDENSSRLEMVLATPLSRARWAIAGGIGMLVNIAIFVALTAAGIAIGVASAGSEVTTPAIGSLVLGLYAAALVGIGHAVGGVLGTRFAATAVVIFVVVTWFVQLLGPLLNLPQVVRDLALTGHFGQPMVGAWDGTGVVVSLVLAVGGIAIGMWGFSRRDLRR